MESSIKVCLIVAKARNNVIGVEGELPWRLAADLAFFKETTLGKPVIMGRKTWESLPKRPLPGRDNIVLSREWNYSAPGARVYTSFAPGLNAARSMAARSGAGEVFVIGGASLYERAMPLADRLYVTEVDAEPEGDVHFPDFAAPAWAETWSRAHAADTRNAHDFTIRRYDRAAAGL